MLENLSKSFEFFLVKGVSKGMSIWKLAIKFSVRAQTYVEPTCIFCSFEWEMASSNCSDFRREWRIHEICLLGVFLVRLNLQKKMIAYEKRFWKFQITEGVCLHLVWMRLKMLY